jgi:hypothetical protein
VSYSRQKDQITHSLDARNRELLGFERECLLVGGPPVKATVLVAVGYALWFIVGAVVQTAIMLPIGWLTAPG